MATITLRQYITAGRATFTLQNPRTGNHYTFKVVRDASEGGNPDHYYVRVLGDNGRYMGLGMLLFGKRYCAGRKREWPSSKVFAWAWDYVLAGLPIPRPCEFLKSTKCARCGRELTTPESIESGFGPECEKRASAA